MTMESTTGILSYSLSILNDARKVNSKASHVKVWNSKAELLHVINDTLEIGHFQGVARDELLDAKSNLFQAETIAGQKAQETYLR